MMNGDALAVQSQIDTANVPRFDYLVNNAQAQALAQNPSAWVIAELSGSYGTPDQAFAAGSSVKVAGYGFMVVDGSKVAWWNQVLTDFENAGY